jgi:hypothetical protein
MDAPSLSEAIAMHESLSARIVTGRVTAVYREWQDPSILEGMKANAQTRFEEMRKTARDLYVSSPTQLAQTERDIDRRLARSGERIIATTLNTAGPREIFFAFDQESKSYVQRSHLVPERDALIRQYGLSRVGVLNLHSDTNICSLNGQNLRYDSGSNAASIGPYQGPGMQAAELLAAGFLDRKVYGLGSQEAAVIDSSDPNLVHYSIDLARPGSRMEVVLDSRFGFRVAQARLYRGGNLVREENCTFKAYGEDIFLESFERKRFDATGRLLIKQGYAITSAEINPPISPDEFRIEVPPDAIMFDNRTGARYPSPFSPEALPEAELKATLPVDPATLAERLLTDAATRSIEHAAEAALFSKTHGGSVQVAAHPASPPAGPEARSESRHYVAYIGAFGIAVVLLVGFLSYRISAARRT